MQGYEGALGLLDYLTMVFGQANRGDEGSESIGHVCGRTWYRISRVGYAPQGPIQMGVMKVKVLGFLDSSRTFSFREFRQSA